MSDRTLASYVRDAFVDHFEPALIRYIETSLRSAFGDDWEAEGLGEMRTQFERNAEKRSKPYSDHATSILGLGDLDTYRSVIFKNQALFHDWPWSDKDTQRLFSNMLDVRGPASHGGTEISVDYAKTVFINVKMVLEAIDPFVGDEVRSIEREAFASGDAPIPKPPLANVTPHEMSARALVDREFALAELKTKLRQKYARAICVTGRGGVGKTALVKRYLLEVLETNEDNYEVVLFLSAKRAELSHEGVSELVPEYRSLDDIVDALLVLFGEGDAPGQTSEEKLGRVQDEVLSELKCLLVLDNLETTEHDAILGFIERFPSHGGSRIVFTSRDNFERSSENDIRLDRLTDNGAIRLATSVAKEFGVVDPLKRRQKALDFVNAIYRNPLAIITQVPRLATQTVEQLIERVRGFDDLELQEFSWRTSLDSLTEQARAVLLTYSLFNQPASKEEVCAVSKLTPNDVDDSIKRLRRFHFIVGPQENRSGVAYVVDPDAAGYVLRLFPKHYVVLYQDVRGRFIAFRRLGEEGSQLDAHIEALLKRANAAIYRRDFTGGATAALEIINLRPSNPDAYGILALTDLRSGQSSSARENFERFEKHGGTAPSTYREWGHLEYRAGNLELASEKLQKALSGAPEDPEFNHYYGVALSMLGKKQMSEFLESRARTNWEVAESHFAKGFYDDLGSNFRFHHNHMNYCARVANLMNLAGNPRDDEDIRGSLPVLEQALRVGGEGLKEHADSDKLAYHVGRAQRELQRRKALIKNATPAP